MTSVSLVETEVSKSQFEAKALEILRRVEATGEPVLVTDHGKPTIKVRRHRAVERSPLDLLGAASWNTSTRPRRWANATSTYCKHTAREIKPERLPRRGQRD